MIVDERNARIRPSGWRTTLRARISNFRHRPTRFQRTPKTRKPPLTPWKPLPTRINFRSDVRNEFDSTGRLPTLSTVTGTPGSETTTYADSDDEYIPNACGEYVTDDEFFADDALDFEEMETEARYLKGPFYDEGLKDEITIMQDGRKRFKPLEKTVIAAKRWAAKPTRAARRGFWELEDTSRLNENTDSAHMRGLAIALLVFLVIVFPAIWFGMSWLEDREKKKKFGRRGRFAKRRQ